MTHALALPVKWTGTVTPVVLPLGYLPPGFGRANPNRRWKPDCASRSRPSLINPGGPPPREAVPGVRAFPLCLPTTGRTEHPSPRKNTYRRKRLRLGMLSTLIGLHSAGVGVGPFGRRTPGEARAEPNLCTAIPRFSRGPLSHRTAPDPSWPGFEDEVEGRLGGPAKATEAALSCHVADAGLAGLRAEASPFLRQ